MDTQQTKRCPRCAQDRSLEEFGVKFKATGQLLSWCKPCYTEVGHERYELKKLGLKRPRKPAPPPLTERECSECHVVMPIDAFRPHKGRCRPCERTVAAAYYAAHPGKQAEAFARYRDSHRDELKQAAKQRYYSGDPRYGMPHQKAWRDANPDKTRAASKRYKAAHPDYNRITVAKRRARILGAVGTYTLLEWEALKQRFDYRCVRCGRKEPVIALTFDHIVPLTRGGDNTIANGQPLCGPCNSSKNTRSEDWRYRYELAKARGEV